MEPIGLFVSIPIASFRIPRAREYFETFPCPPPSTVYGMLLSMVGEVNRRVHEGAEIAIAMLSEPACSIVLRTVWRVKDRGTGMGIGTNRRPDFQELLSDIRLAVWVRQGTTEAAGKPLARRVQDAIDSPRTACRFGGLSLGESTHLVDEVRGLAENPDCARFLVNDAEGDLAMPVWPDHVGAETAWGQYSLVTCSYTGSLPPAVWTRIARSPVEARV